MQLRTSPPDAGDKSEFRQLGFLDTGVAYPSSLQSRFRCASPRFVGKGRSDLDINTVTEVVRRPPDPPGRGWRAGDACLAGGTWLFSDQQPDLRRLIDLMPLGWDTLLASVDGLEIGAMCTVRDLYAFSAPADWRAAPLFTTSCEAFLASFKVWNSATVGGNICMSLPAGPMITMTVALEATYTLRAPTDPNAPSPRSISSPATTRTSSGRVKSSARSTSPRAHCESGTPTAGSR